MHEKNIILLLNESHDQVTDWKEKEVKMFVKHRLFKAEFI